MAAMMVRDGSQHQRGQGTQWTGKPGKHQFSQKDNPMKTTLRKLTVAWPLVIFLLLPVLTRAETAVQAWVQPYNGGFAVAVDGNDAVIVTGTSATTKYSSAGVPVWTNSFNGPWSSDNEAYAVAVDSDNNVIVTGLSGYSLVYHCATIKYSSAGAPLWTNTYSGPGSYDDAAEAVAVDGNNDVIIAGYSISSAGTWGYATIKYSSAGVPLWTNRCDWPAGAPSCLDAVAVDGNNDVIVTGYFTGSGGDYNYATIKYSSAGVPLWTNLYNISTNSDSSCVAIAVAVDANNDVIVAGRTDLDYATIKYSSAGLPLWTNLYGPLSANNRFCVIALDRSGNVIVARSAAGSGGDSDYLTIKYSSAGLPLWTNYYNGPANGDDYAYAVAVDGSNNVIVTGYSTNSAGGYDYATIKYSGVGVPLWTNRYNGPGNNIDWTTGVAVDRSGNVIVTGQSYDSHGVPDSATIKYICVPEPVMTGLLLTNGTFQMEVDDVLQPGTLVIEASTDLALWSPVFTNTTPTNVLFYADPDATNYPWRFYRVFQSP
jgi:hypothetical protein